MLQLNRFPIYLQFYSPETLRVRFFLHSFKQTKPRGYLIGQSPSVQGPYANLQHVFAINFNQASDRSPSSVTSNSHTSTRGSSHSSCTTPSSAKYGSNYLQTPGAQTRPPFALHSSTRKVNTDSDPRSFAMGTCTYTNAAS